MVHRRHASSWASPTRSATRRVPGAIEAADGRARGHGHRRRRRPHGDRGDAGVALPRRGAGRVAGQRRPPHGRPRRGRAAGPAAGRRPRAVLADELLPTVTSWSSRARRSSKAALARAARSSTLRAKASRWRLSRKYDATPESANAMTTGHSRLIRPSPSSRRPDAEDEADHADEQQDAQAGVDEELLHPTKPRRCPGAIDPEGGCAAAYIGRVKFLVFLVLVALVVYVLVRVAQQRGLRPPPRRPAAPPPTSPRARRRPRLPARPRPQATSGGRRHRRARGTGSGT